jgi:hypothetical protein
MKTITKPPVGNGVAPLKALRGLSSAARVDRVRNVISGVSVIQVGPLNEGDSRPWFIDATTAKQVVSMGNASPKGLKARWTHPGMSNDGLGTFLGRWRKFRLSDDGTTVLADLHVSRLAMKGEDSRGEYVLDMAEQEPDAFGVSIYPVANHSEMESLETEDGVQPMRLRKLIAADVVDEPAATRGGFFGGQLSIATAPAKATQALDRLFANAEPDVIRGRVGDFLESYLASRFGGQSLSTGDSEMSDQSKPAAPAAITQEALTAALNTFGENLLGKVDEKLSALTKSDEPQPPTADEIRRAGAKEASEIMSAAAMSGLPDYEKLAADAIEKGLSSVAFKASLTDRLIAGNGLSKDSGQQDEDEDAKYKAEYRAQLAAFTAMGLTEAEYILSRKIDDKKENLSHAA